MRRVMVQPASQMHTSPPTLTLTNVSRKQENSEFFTFSLNLPKQLPEVVFDSATWWLDYVHKYAGRSPPYECCSIPSRRFRNWAKANQQQVLAQPEADTIRIFGKNIRVA
ncbi:hypothetical protein PCANC_13576, partial [Puccinia coronata f. sp. avenae]